MIDPPYQLHKSNNLEKRYILGKRFCGRLTAAYHFDKVLDMGNTLPPVTDSDARSPDKAI